MGLGSPRHADGMEEGHTCPAHEHFMPNPTRVRISDAAITKIERFANW
jgi:hypothetical protein